MSVASTASVPPSIKRRSMKRSKKGMCGNAEGNRRATAMRLYGGDLVSWAAPARWQLPAGWRAVYLTPTVDTTQLQATLDKIPAYTWYANPTGGLTFVNTRCADSLRLPRDHPLRLGAETHSAWDAHLAFVHPDDAAESRRVWSDCLKTGSPGETSFRVQNFAGTYRWFLTRAEPLRANDGTILHWIGINLDIEDRKRAEIELRQMLDLAPQLIAVLGPKRERLYANRTALTYLGSTLEEW